jgi:spoIIIJ-associated protein
MNDSMEESIQHAKKYLEDLLSFFGLNTEVYATAEDDVIELSVPSTHMNGFLIGQHGETVRAIQYLVSMSLKSKDFEYVRVNVDIADYKKARNDRLAEKVTEWVEAVKKSGESMQLKPMNPADRRVVHKVVADYGLSTESHGEGRDRHIVIMPSASTQETEQAEE